MKFSKPHLTAIKRSVLSAPARLLNDDGLIEGRCLDFGCGLGIDAALLGIEGFDPVGRSFRKLDEARQS